MSLRAIKKKKMFSRQDDRRSAGSGVLGALHECCDYWRAHVCVCASIRVDFWYFQMWMSDVHDNLLELQLAD